MTKNITFGAEENIIEDARKRARSEGKSLNAVFREWLFRYACGYRNRSHAVRLMDKFGYADAGKTFTRDRMNER